MLAHPCDVAEVSELAVSEVAFRETLQWLGR